MSGDVMAQAPLVQHFDLIAQAPGGVARLRELILTLAVQGKLVPQDPSDEPASELLKRIRTEKDRLISEGKIKRDKLLPSIVDQEKPFELPQKWEWAMVGHVAETNTGFAFKSSEYKSEGTLVFRVTNIKPDGSVDLSDSKFIDPISAETTYKAFKLQAGDVLLVMVGGSLGKIGLVDEDCLPAVLNQNMWKISINKNIDRQFFVLCMRYINRHQLKVTSSTHGHLAQGEYLQKLVGLPPLAEQSRIVTRVEELMQLCDALEASGQLEAQQHAQLVNTLLGTLTQSETPEALADNWQRIATHFDLLLDRPEAVDALEQTILQLAVRGLLVPQDPTDEPASVLLQKIRTEKDHLIAQGKIKRDKPLPPITEEEKPFELPQGWAWARLGDVGMTQTGGTPNKNNPEHFGTAIPFIKPGDIYPERVDYQNEGLSLLGAESLGRTAEAGSILMVCIGTIGKSNLIDRSCSFNQQINSVTPVLLLPEYLLAVLRSAYFHNEAWSRSSSTTISILNKGKWESIPIPVPPLQEQSRILNRFGDFKRLNRELKSMLTEAIQLSRRISDAIVSVSTV